MTRARRAIWTQRILEFTLFDSQIVKSVVGVIGTLVGLLTFRFGLSGLGFAILGRIHRSAFLPWASRRAECLVQLEVGQQLATKRRRLNTVLRDYVTTVSATPHTDRYFKEPHRLLNGNTLVLKSASERERGVLFLYYSYTYPLFARFFDIEAVAERYHLVLEPSWSGFCDPNILLFTGLQHPVFVGGIEPRDCQFVERLNSNLKIVPCSSNSWVDHRVFVPIDGIHKDIDIVMLAAWASYKRHWAFFRALRRAKRRGRSLRAMLVGYPGDLSRADLERQAVYFGVAGQVEFLENLGPDEVNLVLNRSKVNVLWSRREGVNRAIIEGMFAGVPCIVREGFNYGYHYPYINSATGRFSSEERLPADLIDMTESHERYSPRARVLPEMSCQHSTALLNEVIRANDLQRGNSWTTDIVVKTNALGGLRYWNLDDSARFTADYDYLRSATRPR